MKKFLIFVFTFAILFSFFLIPSVKAQFDAISINESRQGVFTGEQFHINLYYQGQCSNPPENISFTAPCALQPGGVIDPWHDIGGGLCEGQLDADYICYSAGTWTFLARFWQDSVVTAFDSQDILAETNQTPSVSQLTANKTTARIGEEIVFYPSGNSQNNEKVDYIERWWLEYNPGTGRVIIDDQWPRTNTFYGESKYSFSQAGAYQIYLGATDRGGLTDWSSLNITIIANQPPTADFSGSPTAGSSPLKVNFSDKSTDSDGTVTNWIWDFDNDGEGDSFSQNPSVTYGSEGTYSVRLKVFDNDSLEDTEIKTDYITVTAPLSNYTLTITKDGAGSGTVTSDPAGINCGGDCSESYASGTLVSLTASADSGSSFAGWSEDADCNDGSVTMNADKPCTATFTVIATPTLSISEFRATPSSINTGDSTTLDASYSSNVSGDTWFCYDCDTSDGEDTAGCGTGYCNFVSAANTSDSITCSGSYYTIPDTYTAKVQVCMPSYGLSAEDTTTLSVSVSAPGNQPPVAVATISKDGKTYTDSITVVQGVATPIYLSADGSSDPNGWTDVAKCEWNSDLNKGEPTFETTVNNPATASACNINLGSKTFNDLSGTYTYKVLRITDKPGLQSNVDTVQVIVQESPPIASGIYWSFTTKVTQPPIAGASAGGKCDNSPIYPPGTSVDLATNAAGCASSDPDGTIKKFEWDWTSDSVYDYSCCSFGCSALIVDSACNINRIYNSAAVTKLRVTDDDGATATDTVNINICSIACEQDSQCNDNDSLTKDTCKIMPNPCDNYCVYTPIISIKFWREILPKF